MDLNKVNIVIRPRPAYEGLDLGFAMASRWFLTLWVLWLVTALPLSLIISVFFRHEPEWALLIIWWLKPLYETPPLYWISRMIFGERTGMKTMVKSMFSIVRPRLISRLTIRRFSPSRSFYMPVILLENMSGRAYSRRTAILGHNESAGFVLTMICLMFEGVLFIAAMIFLNFLLTESVRPFGIGDVFSGSETLADMAVILVYLGAMSVMAPFYVAAGFALYLTRRTRLEAWDIELNFKRLVERKKQKTRPMPHLVVLACLVTLMMGMTGPAHGSEISRDQAKKTIEDVLSHEDFGKTETVTDWKFREFRKEKDKEKESNSGIIDFMESLIKWVAILVKPLLWICGGLLLVLFAYFAMKYAGVLRPGDREPVYTPPDELFGLKLTQDSLPEDLPAEVLKRLSEDDVRGALGLLYRGTLYKLIYVFFLDIPKSATEGECLTLVAKRRRREEADFFSELTRVWQRMAYGHIRPEIPHVRNLCETWSHYYAS